MGKGEEGRATGAVRAATDAVKQRLGTLKPRIAIVLGSGLGFLAGEVTGSIRIPYRTIPGFPEPGVAGHKGELVAGTLEGVPVIVQGGRFHLYEGHPAAVAGLPTRVFAELGVEILIVTNAAGGVRRTFPGGTLMLIADHLNLMWRNPLIGQPEPGEQRFPIMHEPYDGELRALARTVAARSRGMRCLGFSIITNPGAGITGEALSHEEVLAVSEQVARKLAVVVKGVLRRIK